MPPAQLGWKVCTTMLGFYGVWLTFCWGWPGTVILYLCLWSRWCYRYEPLCLVWECGNINISFISYFKQKCLKSSKI
jgi:hypothetical protein